MTSTPAPSSPERLRDGRLALALYALLLVASLVPQSLRPWDTVGYVGDSLDTVYFLANNVHRMFTDPLHFFDANILYPHRRAGLFDTHRILSSLLAAPVLGLTGNPILAYNVVLAVAYLFAAMAARHLARALGLSALAAWTAGALYAFHTYQVIEAPRVNVVFHGFWPLAVLELVRYLRTGERRHAWRVAGWMLLQGYADNYNVLYGALLLTLIAAGVALARPRLLAARVPGLVPPALLAALLFLPVAWPYAQAAKAYGYTRGLPTGIDLQHYVTTPPGNLLYGARGAEFRLQQRAPHFVGFVTLMLAAVALLGLRRDEEGPLLPPRVWVPAACGLALLFGVLALGKDLVAFGRPLGPGPYRALHAFVPAFEFIRIPERLSLVAMLFVALLMARGLAVLQAGGWKRLVPALAVLVPLEHVGVLPSTERIAVGRDVPDVYRWLAAQPVRALAEVPIHGEHLVRKESLEEYFSTYHWKPIVHGYVSYPPLLSRLLRRAAGEFPEEGALQVFDRVGVDTVVVHHGRVGAESLPARLEEAMARGRLQRVARFAAPQARVLEGTLDEVYRILPAAPLAAAPLPAGRRLREPGWHYRAKEGEAARAGDGDPDTAWEVTGPLQGDEFFEVTFGGKLQRVSALVLPLDRESAFPTRFRVAGRRPDGSWFELARLDDRHLLQLVDQLLARPGQARLGLDLGGREVTGVSLLVSEGATSFDGWHLGEVELLGP